MTKHITHHSSRITHHSSLIIALLLYAFTVNAIAGGERSGIGSTDSPSSTPHSLTGVSPIASNPLVGGVSVESPVDVWCLYPEKPTDQELRIQAQNCTVIWGVPYRENGNRIKSLGSKVKWTIVYMNFGHLHFCPPRCNWSFERLFADWVQTHHPEFILRDAKGDFVVEKFGGRHKGYLMDIGNPEYRRAWADFMFSTGDFAPPRNKWQGLLKANLDGAWADNTNYHVNSNKVPINPRTRKPYTDLEYARDWLGAMKDMKRIFDERSREAGRRFFWIPNVARNWWRSLDSYNRLKPSPIESIIQEGVNTVDAFQLEDFVFRFTKNYDNPRAYSLEEWKRQIEFVRGILKNKRSTVILNIHTKLFNDAYWYGISSYLLIKEGLLFYKPRPQVESKERLMELPRIHKTTALGKPLGDLFQTSPDCYQRNWTQGLVVVNPKDKGNCTFNLDGSYIDQSNGLKVQSITLGPKRGTVLIKR
jgi:hypothetical protein